MPDNKEKYAQLQESIAKHKGERGAVMPVLQEAMNIFGYVPQDVQEMIADGLGVTLAVWGFYLLFPVFAGAQGRACHRRMPGNCLLREGQPEDSGQDL